MILAIISCFSISSVICTTLFATLDTPFEGMQRDDSVTLSVESVPLRIESNEEFIALGLPGQGTKENPFRLENLEFDLSISGGNYAIYIFDTNVSFIIQECAFTGKLSSPYGFGIYLWNVSNFEIMNNNFTRVNSGVWWMGGRDGRIVKNTFYGINLNDYDHDSLAISIQWNQINSTRVVVEENRIFNCAAGIDIFQAEDGIFRKNEMTNCSFGFRVGYVFRNITVIDNICNNGTYTGIYVIQSQELQITNNTCNFNRLYGIWMDEYSSNVTIAFNEACWNGNTSIFIQQPVSSFWILSDLREACGIWISPNSEGNHIFWNDLANNLNNALNDAEGNSYDYNYWSDYEGSDDDDNKIGDQPYLVSGYVSSIDIHPRLKTLNEWNSPDGVENTTSTSGNSNPLNLDVQQLILIVSGVGAIIVVIVFVRTKR